MSKTPLTVPTTIDIFVDCSGSVKINVNCNFLNCNENKLKLIALYYYCVNYNHCNTL